MKSASVLNQQPAVKYAVIAENAGNYPVAWMCRQLSKSGSGYFDWRIHQPSTRDCQDSVHAIAILHEFQSSQETYGSRRLVQALRRIGA